MTARHMDPNSKVHSSENDIVNSIGILEPHFHDLFINSRINGEDFVFCNVFENIIQKIEDYCSVISALEVKSPLVISGIRGIGKSTLLANWVVKRKQLATLNRELQDEYIFFHAAGSSKQSTNIYGLLRRIIVDLKNKFEIKRNIPLEQDRLPWELRHFLDLASKKGRVIIILDGLNKLSGNDDSDLGISWLPVEYPPGVRVIVSVTSATLIESDDNVDFLNDYNEKVPPINDETKIPSRQFRMEFEIRRREWKILTIRKLERMHVKMIINDFVRKTVQDEISFNSATPFLTEDADDDKMLNLADSGSLLLLDSQVNILLSHPLVGIPLFLRLFLKNAHFAIRNGFSLWYIFDSWLQCDTIEHLLLNILNTFQEGHKCTAATQQRDINRTVLAGGFPSLRNLYPWHPIFESKALDNVSRRQTFRLDDKLKDAIEVEDDLEQNILSDNQHHFNFTESDDNDSLIDTSNRFDLAKSVLRNLGDQQWLSASEDANDYFEKIRFSSEKSLTSTLEFINYSMTSNLQSNEDSFDKMINFVLSLESKAAIQDNSTKNNLDTNVEDDSDIDSDESSFSDEDTFSSEVDSARESKSKENQIEDSQDASTKIAVGIRRNNILGNRARHNSINREKVTFSDEKPLKVSNNRNHASSEIYFKSSKLESKGLHSTKSIRQIDPSNGIQSLPKYLRGGVEWKGIGQYLRDSLCLLHVARNGLTESEMWNILGSLSNSTDNIMNTSNNVKLADMNLMNTIIKEKGNFIASCRSYLPDKTHSSKLSKDQIFKSIRMVSPQASISDMKALIKSFPDCKVDGDVDFEILVKCIIKYKKTQEASKINKYNDDINSARGSCFGPVIEKILLEILRSLGLIHSVEYEVVVLPPDFDSLRHIILKNFIGDKSSDGIILWHTHLIKYFQAEKNTMRRCEELPWHLKICRRWHAMRDILSDLETFNIMYVLSSESNISLRVELLSYWLQLTGSDGDLYVSDEAQKESLDNIRNFNLGDMSTSLTLSSVQSNSIVNRATMEKAHLLFALDNAIKLGLSEKEAKKHRMKNIVAPFDIIEEYNKALEYWIQESNPSPIKINLVISNIGDFLIDFGLVEWNPPQFLRLGIKMEFLENFNITFEKLNEMIRSMAALSLPANETYVPSEFGSPSGSMKKELKQVEELVFPTSAMLQSNHFYQYLRWVWVQFPWLALKNAMNREKAIEESIEYSYVDNNSSITTKALSEGSKNRFWEVKKFDPGDTTKLPVVKNKEINRMAAITTSTSKANSLMSLDIMFKRLQNDIQKKVQEISTIPQLTSKLPDINEALSMKTLNAPITSISNSSVRMSKYRRSLDEDIEAMKGIPFSKHSNKSLRLGTLFPSVDSAIAAKTKDNEDDQYFSEAKRILKLGGNININQPKLVDIIESNRLNEELEFINAARVSIIPINKSEDVLCEQERNRIEKLKGIYDKIKAMEKAKTQELKILSEKYYSRCNEDIAISSDLRNGEAAIAELNKEVDDIVAAVENARGVQNGYLRLIEFQSKNPPYHDNSIKVLEQELNLARQQVNDLLLHRYSMNCNAAKEYADKKKSVSHRIEYYDFLMKSISQKKSAFKAYGRNMFTETKDNVFMTNVDISNDDDDIEERKETIEELNTNLDVYSIDNNETQRKKEEKAKKLYNLLQQSTGCRSYQDFIERFHGNLKLSELFQNDKVFVDSKLAHLKIENQELISALSDASLKIEKQTAPRKSSSSKNQISDRRVSIFNKDSQGNDMSSTPSFVASNVRADDKDVRYYELKISEETKRLVRLEKDLDKYIRLIHSVKLAVIHLMSLLTANDSILHNLPIDPPLSMESQDTLTLNKKMQSNLSANYYSEIGKGLSWCEGRILAINEFMMIETAKPKALLSKEVKEDNTFNTNDPMQIRQTKLAQSIFNITNESNINTKQKHHHHHHKHLHFQEKIAGGISKRLVEEFDPSRQLLSDPSAIVVDSLEQSKISLNNSITRRYSELDSKLALIEQQDLWDQKLNSTAVIKQFVSEALNTEASQHLLFKSKKLSKSALGKKSAYGWVLDQVLKSKGSNIDPSVNIPVSSATNDTINIETNYSESPRKNTQNRVYMDT